MQHVTGAEVPKTYKTFATIHKVSVPHVRKIKWRNYVKRKLMKWIYGCELGSCVWW